MSAVTALQVEDDIKRLPLSDQLWLIERLAHHIRQQTGEGQATPPHGVMGNQEHQSALRGAPEADESGTDEQASFESSSNLPPLHWADKSPLLEGLDLLLDELGIEIKPIGAKALREMMQAEGILGPNELSRGIIEMREEKLRARGLF